MGTSPSNFITWLNVEVPQLKQRYNALQQMTTFTKTSEHLFDKIFKIKLVSLTVNLIVVPEVACCELKTTRLKIYFDYKKQKE